MVFVACNVLQEYHVFEMKIVCIDDPSETKILDKYDLTDRFEKHGLVFLRKMPIELHDEMVLVTILVTKIKKKVIKVLELYEIFCQDP